MRSLKLKQRCEKKERVKKVDWSHLLVTRPVDHHQEKNMQENHSKLQLFALSPQR